MEGTMKERGRGACLAVIGLVGMGLVLAGPASPQTGAGGITGRVTGPDGLGLPGGTISIRNLATGAVVRVISGDLGVYRVRDLGPGSYELKAELPGFEPRVITDVKVSASEFPVVDFKLRPAIVHESVTVIGKVPRASLESQPARESSARDIGEALTEVSGVSKVRKGGIANDVVLRGFAGKDLNVLVDGERMYGACPNSMDPSAFHADFAEIERVEIGKGPFDVRNQGSLGGVVNIITRRPLMGFRTSANFSAGSQGYLNPALTASYGAERLSALGGFSYRRAEPYTDGSGKRFSEYGNFRPGLVESDAFRVGTAWANVAVRPRRNHTLQFAFTRQEADHVLYPYLMMDAVYDNGDRLNFGYEIGGSGLVKSLRLQGYFTDVSHWMTDEFRTSSLNLPRSYSMGTRAKTETFGGKVEATLRSLVIGVEAFRRAWDAATEMAGSGYAPQFSIPDATTDVLGFYADYGTNLTNDLRLSLGGRLDTAKAAADPAKANTNLYYAYHSTVLTSATDTYPSGSVRLSYSLSPALEVSGSFGHMVRVPDARERYFALKRMGSDWVGNPGLRPSKNTGIDLGFSWRGRGLSVEPSFYWNSIADFVIVMNQARQNDVPGVMNTMARSYQNVDAAIYGSDLDVAYSLTSKFFLAGGLAVVRGTQTPRPDLGAVSRNLAEIPPFSSRASLRYDDGRVMAEVQGIFAGAQTRINSELREEATPGYVVLNLRLGWNLLGATVRLGLDNLLDKAYFDFLSYQRDPFRSGVRVLEPGRNLYLSLSYRY
jgi:iron complex outermembrane receptor protein